MNRRMFGASLVLTAAGATAATGAPAPVCKPSCGGLTEDDLRAYLAKFNAKDYAGFSAYYAPDVIFQGQAAQVVGRQKVVDFYLDAHKHVKETVTLGPVIVGEQGIAAELHTHLDAFEDFPLRGGIMKKGESRTSINFAIYEVRDRHFWRVRTASYQRQV